MLKKAISSVIRTTHYWRTVSFDELSELYVNVLLRSLANSLVGIFVPIYLYKLGYSLDAIAVFFVAWFALRPLYDFLNARFVGRFGPKHGLALAAAGHTIYLLFLVTIESQAWPLWLIGQIGSFSTSMHLIAFHTDFSKIKHSEHGGKEISYVSILEKIGGISGPLIGGLIANFYDPRYAIGLAIILQAVSLIPLFLTKEAVQIKQTIRYKGLPWRRHISDFVSTVPFSVEGFVTLVFWPLFLAVVVIPDDTYAKVGIMVALSTTVSLLATRIIGILIDESRGGLLLRTGVILNSTLHIFRPFVTTFFGAVVVNLINDPVTAAYRMPYMKGLYDAADSVPGYRIAYLSLITMLDSFAKFLVCCIFLLLTVLVDPRQTFIILFIGIGIFSLGILFERFPALRR